MVLILLGDLACSLKFEACEIIITLLAWDQALPCGKKEKKSALVKEKISVQSKLRGSLGRRKGGGAWRHVFDAADLPSSN